MRLIDADKLEAYGTTVPKECNAEDYISGVRDVLEHIDSMPTVEAIPIEHIKEEISVIEKAIEEYGGISEYDDMVNAWIAQSSSLDRLLKGWAERKELED